MRAYCEFHGRLSAMHPTFGGIRTVFLCRHRCSKTWNSCHRVTAAIRFFSGLERCRERKSLKNTLICLKLLLDKHIHLHTDIEQTIAFLILSLLE